jgi:hypothetical protein
MELGNRHRGEGEAALGAVRRAHHEAVVDEVELDLDDSPPTWIADVPRPRALT